MRGISEYKSPGAYIRRGDLTEGFKCYEFEALIFGGAYFRNFTERSYRFRYVCICDCLYTDSVSSLNSTGCFDQELNNLCRKDKTSMYAGSPAN